MRISFIGHASILIECDGIRILSDPWWSGPCFGAQWWTYPPPFLTPIVEDPKIDFIYISHGHHDHCHPGTLKTLSRDATVLVSNTLDLADEVRGLGFPVLPIAPDQVYQLTGSASCRIVPSEGGDTLMAVSDAKEVCLNLNDAMHAAHPNTQDRIIGELKDLYPQLDYVFCGYGMASHFPNCYVIPEKDRERSAARRQAYFNRQWSSIIDRLEPRFGFPFAADVALLEDDLIWANEPVHNSERPVDAFRIDHPDSTTRVVDIAPGFIIEDGEIRDERVRETLGADYLRKEYADSIRRANSYGQVTPEAIQEVKELITSNVALCTDYLNEFSGDYHALIKFRNSPNAISIAKKGKAFIIQVIDTDEHNEIDYDLIMTTRLPYLRWSLSKKYGDEIIFVGSGAIFEYMRRDRVKAALHKELRVIVTLHDSAPKSRFGDSSPHVFHLKRFIKSMLGLQEKDLYGLDDWTVYRA